MTFLDRKTTRDAQRERKNKRKVETPDRPGTNLAYSHTSKRPQGLAYNSVGAAILEAQRKAQEEHKADAAAAMRKMAGGRK